ncbi:MAG: 30S ribosomal protein S5 [Patescibacteria group bacterium]
MVVQKLEKTEYDQKLLDVARVVRVVAGGRRFRFRAVVVVGNRKGGVGVGVAKGQDVTLAVEKAASDAKKHLIEVFLTEGTIPHQVEAKYCSARVLLKPGAKGKGIVAGGAVRIVSELAGIENLSGKILGNTKNKLNNARATIEALKKLKKK